MAADDFSEILTRARLITVYGNHEFHDNKEPLNRMERW